MFLCATTPLAGDNLTALRDRIEQLMAAGYDAIAISIGPADHTTSTADSLRAIQDDAARTSTTITTTTAVQVWHDNDRRQPVA